MSDSGGRKPVRVHGTPAGDPAALRLQVVASRSLRSDAASGKAGVNLSDIFVQLSELQQRFGQQIGSLEEGIRQQRQELVNTLDQLPEIREKLNWLIASFYEQGKKEVSLRERVHRQETAIQDIARAVSSICESQARWKAIMEELAGVLERAGSVPASPPPEIATG